MPQSTVHLVVFESNLTKVASVCNKKICNAQVDKVIYMLVIGDKELESNTINVRHRPGEIIEPKSCQDLIDRLNS